MTNLLKLSELKPNTWFTKVSDNIKNCYLLVDHCIMPGFSGATLCDEIVEMESDTEVELINGFQLYLLQGGSCD